MFTFVLLNMLSKVDFISNQIFTKVSLYNLDFLFLKKYKFSEVHLKNSRAYVTLFFGEVFTLDIDKENLALVSFFLSSEKERNSLAYRDNLCLGYRMMIILMRKETSMNVSLFFFPTKKTTMEHERPTAHIFIHSFGV